MSTRDVYLGLKKSTATVLYTQLASPADADVWISNPTLAAGDVRVSIDGAAFAPIGTLPAVTPAGDVAVKIILTSGEMAGDNIVISFKDQTATEEWQAHTILIRTTAVTVDDLVRSTTPANTFDVSATGEGGLDFNNIKDATGAHTLTNITVPAVTTVATLTGHTAQTGDAFARLGAPSGASVSADILAIKNKTDSLTFTVANVVDANSLRLGGMVQTGRDVGASVLLSPGTGTGQLDFTSGIVKANQTQILGTALTETAGQIAAAFKKFFDVATPVFTCQAVNQTGDSFARVGAPVGASISADIAAVKAETAAIIDDTGTSGVKLNLAQALSESPTALTTGAGLYCAYIDVAHRLVDTGASGARTNYKSDGATPAFTRTRDATGTILTP